MENCSSKKCSRKHDANYHSSLEASHYPISCLPALLPMEGKKQLILYLLTTSKGGQFNLKVSLFFHCSTSLPINSWMLPVFHSAQCPKAWDCRSSLSACPLLLPKGTLEPIPPRGPTEQDLLEVLPWNPFPLLLSWDGFPFWRLFWITKIINSHYRKII